MFLPTAVTNNRLFRLLWWVITLPLEGLRLLLCIPALFLYLLTVRNVTRLWGMVWMLLHFEVIRLSFLPISGSSYDQFFIIGGIFLLCMNASWRIIRRFIRMMLYPFWRLPPRFLIPKPSVAFLAIKPTSDTRQNRNKMTRRLSPALQEMIASPEPSQRR